jgi:copper chaperone CopZ
MIRRRFLGLLTLAGASGAAAITKAAKYSGERGTVTYKVRGFTCITCATGLETLLSREQGVLAVKASYPDAIATVGYDMHSTDEAKIASAIESMGFQAQVLHSAHG